MLPSEIRQRILDDHGQLRRLFADLRELLGEPAAGPSAGAVRELAAALRQRFLAHLDLEERLLVPALRDADAWGAERADRIAREHALQRAQLERLLTHLRDATYAPSELARELDALVSELQVDMEHEERTALSPTLLRDDVIAVDGEPE
jgi:iron-sulfur cluster repair protein YtfE (RIC family)